MFDFSNVEFDDNFGLIPEGEYPSYIEKIEWKTSQAGQEYLNVMFRLKSNRVIFKGFHLNNEKSQLIAKQQLLKLLLAIGHKKESLGNVSKEQLIALIGDRNVNIKIKIKNDQNEVVDFKPFEDKDLTVLNEIGF